MANPKPNQLRAVKEAPGTQTIFLKTRGKTDEPKETIDTRRAIDRTKVQGRAENIQTRADKSGKFELLEKKNPYTTSAPTDKETKITVKVAPTNKVQSFLSGTDNSKATGKTSTGKLSRGGK